MFFFSKTSNTCKITHRLILYTSMFMVWECTLTLVKYIFTSNKILKNINILYLKDLIIFSLDSFIYSFQYIKFVKETISIYFFPMYYLRIRLFSCISNAVSKLYPTDFFSLIYQTFLISFVNLIVQRVYYSNFEK